MENKIEYKEENGYLLRTFRGIFHIDEIMESWEYLINHKLKENKYIGILNDFSCAQLKMEMEDLDKILALFKDNTHIFENLKLAVIMTRPDNIVFPLFAKNTSTFNIGAFTTLEGAKNWILQ